MISRDGDKMSGWWGERTNLGKGETQPNSLRVFYNSISHYNITVTSAKSVNLYFYPQDSLRSRWLEVVGTKKTRAREGDTRGERECLHGRPPKIISRSLSNYLAAIAWSVKSFDRKRLTSHKQSVPPKSVVHFIFGLNISVIKISWVLWL